MADDREELAAEPGRVRPVGSLTVICPECGEVIEVKDPGALVRALHLVNECSLRSLLAAPRE